MSQDSINQLQQENSFLRQALSEVEADRLAIKNTIKKLAEKYGIKLSEENRAKTVRAIIKLLPIIMLNPGSLEEDLKEISQIIEKYSHE